MGAGIVERADRRQLDPPFRRHRDQALDAVLHEAGDQFVAERQRPNADVRILEQARQPGRMMRNADSAIITNAQCGEHRDVELRVSRIGTMTGLLERPRDVRRAGQLASTIPAGHPARHLQRLRPTHAGQHAGDERSVAGRAARRRDRHGGRAFVTFSPASSRRTATIVSSSVVSGEEVRAPICSIHDCTPWPIPGSSRPGASSHRVAISIAHGIAGLRATAGRIPIPTVSRSVVARAAAARVTPAV